LFHVVPPFVLYTLRTMNTIWAEDAGSAENHESIRACSATVGVWLPVWQTTGEASRSSTPLPPVAWTKTGVKALSVRAMNEPIWSRRTSWSGQYKVFAGGLHPCVMPILAIVLMSAWCGLAAGTSVNV
jgi:hypothetical protein